MGFRFNHNNINVRNLEKSMKFYKEALDLAVVGRREREGYTLVFLGDGVSDWRLELTWLHSHAKPYDLGDNEVHFCLTTDKFEAAYQKHQAMGCICEENKELGIYFIQDPDGYWIEIMPAKK